MLNEAFTELQEIHMDKRRIETELKFTQRLKKSGNEYAEHVRAGAIARLLNKDKGDIIHWYETIKEIKINKKNGKQKIINGFSISFDNLNIEQYKKVLTSKLRDTLEIVGIVQSDFNYGIQIMNSTT